MKRQPFITGSRAYGTPSYSSDIDLVIHVEDPDVRRTLEALNETPGKGIHFGRLNLIAVDSEQYDVWKQGRSADGRLCLERKPSSSSLRLKSYEHAEVEQAKTEAIVNGHKPEWHIWYGDT